MRLLITTDVTGDVWTHTLELSRLFAARGFRVALATLGGPLAAVRRADTRRVPGLTVYESDLPGAGPSLTTDDLERAGAWLLFVERHFAPEVVCLNHPHLGIFAWRAAVVTTVHSCALSRETSLHGDSALPSWNDYRDGMAAGLARADLVVAPSEWMLRMVRKIYSPPAPSRAIPYGRAAADFVAGSKKRFVLAAGALWDEGSNIACLAAAARGLPWAVYAAGEERGPDGRLADCNGIRRLGPLPPAQLKGWYAGAAIFAHLAAYEPFGAAPLEAALSGCALVLSDLESLRETWGDSAFYVPPGDSSALAAAFGRILSDDFRASALGSRARARALRFSSNRMADGYEQAFTFAIVRHRENAVARREAIHRAETSVETALPIGTGALGQRTPA